MDAYFLYITSKLEKLRKGPERNLLDIAGELKSWDLWRAVLAEGIATMLFVFVGTSSIVQPTGELMDGGRIVRIGFTFGLMIAVLIQMIGHVSGGHMNPAVSIAMAVTMNISPLRAILYVIVQCGGAILGSLILKSVTVDRIHSNLGLNTVSDQMSAAEGFGCELVYTFILVTSIFGCIDGNRPLFGSPALGIGLTVGVLHFAGIPYTGASMNPARSFGPAVISDFWEHHWVYWAGPIAGGIIAGLLYKFIFDPYRRGLSMDDAMNKMSCCNIDLALLVVPGQVLYVLCLYEPQISVGETDVIVIPKSYFRETEPGIKKLEMFQEKL